MKKDLNTILEELYAIDPGFRKHENELRGLVTELLASKPDTRFDQEFARTLRARLMSERSATAPVRSPYAHFVSWQYGLAGLAVLVLVILPFALNKGPISLKQKVNTREANFFGKLSVNTDNGGKGGGLNTYNAIPPVPASEGVTVGAPSTTDTSRVTTSAVAPTTSNGVSNQTSPNSGTAPVAGNAVSPRMGMATMAAGATAAVPSVTPNAKIAGMPIRPQVITYKYEGAELKLSTTTAKVYRRSKDAEAGNQVMSMLRSLRFPQLNIASFENMKVRSFELYQDTPKGYSIGANFADGTFYINPNWNTWSQQPPKNIAVPSEESLVTMADTFLKQHGIDTAPYGKPVVEEAQYSILKTMSSKSPEYMNQSINVIYPLSIEGQTTFEQGGQPYGLYVTINLAENIVSGVMNINAQIYDGSDYALETDASRILKIATANQQMYYPVDARDASSSEAGKTIGLDTPTQILMRYWNYTQNGEGSELFIPALMFPVKEVTTSDIYPKNIIVPLVKEILDAQNNAPRPMPMIK